MGSAAIEGFAAAGKVSLSNKADVTHIAATTLRVVAEDAVSSPIAKVIGLVDLLAKNYPMPLRTLASAMKSLAMLDIRFPDGGFARIAGQFYHKSSSTMRRPLGDANYDDNCLAAALIYFGFDAQDIAKRPTSTVSGTELMLRNTFQRAGLPLYRNEVVVKRISHVVDGALVGNGRTILIEHDGPTHFRNGMEKYGYNAATLLMSALIRKCAPTASLLRVRFSDAELLSKNPSMLCGLMDDISNEPATVFETYAKAGDVVLRSHLPRGSCCPA